MRASWALIHQQRRDLIHKSSASNNIMRLASSSMTHAQFRDTATMGRLTRHSTKLRATSEESSFGKSNNKSMLQQMLSELANLNGGKAVNPRSPKQVSDLLYRRGSSRNKNGGCTDKNTLLSIINQIEHNGSSSIELDRRKRVAELVLSCRELMSSSDMKSDGFANGRSLPDTLGTKRLQGAFANAIYLQAAAFSNMTSSGSTGIDGPRETYSEMSAANNDTLQYSTLGPDQFEEDISASSQPVLSRMSPYDRMVRSLFLTDDLAAEETIADKTTMKSKQTSLLDPYWMEPLLSLTKASSRSLVMQLQSSCPIGYDPTATPISYLSSRNAAVNTKPKKETPLLSLIRSQKEAHFSDAIILTRVGDFYESYGIDAILLVEHAGLNPMAGRARAGCPWRNIQATLDALTNAGFRVAVYEESNEGDNNEMMSDEEDGNSSGKSRLKTRYLAQVVTSANPTYMHGLLLSDNDGSVSDDTSASTGLEKSSVHGRAYVGVIESHAGYTLVEISADERTVVVSERLTDEAVACRLMAYPPADPMFYVPSSTEDGRRVRSDRLPFLPWKQQNKNQQSFVVLSPTSRVRVKTLPPSLVVEPAPGLTDLERAKQTIVSAFLRLEDDSIARSTNDELARSHLKRRELRRSTHEDFSLITPSPGESLHVETAKQLGLMGDSSIPSLVSSLLPESAPLSSRRFLRRWLLVRPTEEVTDAMGELVRVLKDQDNALPPLNTPSMTGKIISLIRAGQASALVYRNILCALDSAIQLLDLQCDRECADIVTPLLKILQHDTGIQVTDAASLRERFLLTKQTIEEVVNTHSVETSIPNTEEEHISYFGDVVPDGYFVRNEETWRGRVKPSVLERAHLVPNAARRLAETIALDFWGVETISYNNDGEIDLSGAQETKSPIVQDIFNNIIAIKAKPDWAKGSEKENEYIHPHDRNHKMLKTRYTTQRVEEAVSAYIESCDEAKKEVMAALTRLSYELVDGNHLSVISQATHLNLIVSTAAYHAASSNAKGWNLAKVYDESNVDSAGFLNGLWPYWMDSANSVSNTFELDGMFLLTAPNMSGKSTVMRSTAAAALLISSGLCAPVIEGSSIRRFDSIFIRGASADVPTENKSAFGAEMGDVSSLLRNCGSRSLVFVDEIGRGTSPRDGTCLAAALLERMSESNMSGMFATHLHGILNFPLSDDAQKRIRKKRMAMREDERGHMNWTYRLEDGICTNSLALLTAAKFGLPKSIIARAEYLSKYWDENTADTSSPLNSANLPPKASVRTVFEELGKRSSVFIPPSYLPPPSFEGSSCVYILELEGPRSEINKRPRYYVGETDSLARRLSQHRLRGKDWELSSAIAIQVEGGKSSARSLESSVIQQLAKLGFDLVSVADGTRTR